MGIGSSAREATGPRRKEMEERRRQEGGGLTTVSRWSCVRRNSTTFEKRSLAVICASVGSRKMSRKPLDGASRSSKKPGSAMPAP